MRFKVCQTTLVGLAAALLCGGAASAGNLITNGDFETGSLTPWAVSGQVEDVTESDYGPCCGFTTTHPGNHIAAFGSGFGTGVEVLSQSFSTVAGQAYLLDYDWGFVGGSANTLDVTVGGITHSFAGDGSTDFDTAFTHDMIQFVGSGAPTTLSFTVHDGALDSTDTVIDNVSIHAIPEPATWGLMLSGFGVAGAALRRRRALGQAV